MLREAVGVIADIVLASGRGSRGETDEGADLSTPSSFASSRGQDLNL
jgi:hypothetical protein